MAYNTRAPAGSRLELLGLPNDLVDLACRHPPVVVADRARQDRQQAMDALARQGAHLQDRRVANEVQLPLDRYVHGVTLLGA